MLRIITFMIYAGIESESKRGKRKKSSFERGRFFVDLFGELLICL